MNMNKVIAIACLLACGTAFADEKAKELTPAQKIEVAKQIAIQTAVIDGEIERHTKELEQTPPDDEGAVRLLKVRLKALNELKEEIHSDDSLYWTKLRKKKKYDRLYWKEPAEGEKEGKWVPWKEVAG